MIPETLFHLFINGCMALIGWMAFNAIMFSMDKDTALDGGEITVDKVKSYWLQYKLKNFDNWIASLWMVPILLFIGYKGLKVPDFGIGELTWSDLYYPCAGFATELVRRIWKKVRGKE